MKDNKSEGHKKLERVHRRLEVEVAEMQETLKNLSSFLTAAGKFPSLGAKAQSETIDQLKSADKGTSRIAKLQDDLKAEKAERLKVVEYLNNRKKQVTELSRYEREFKQISGPATRQVNAAKNTLWGGYAAEGLSRLQALAENPSIPRNIRATASYQLARFYMDSGQYYSALKCMTDARGLSKTVMRGTRERLVELELFLRTGDTDSAQKRLGEYRELRPSNPDYRVMECNLRHYLGDIDGKYETLNQLFTDNGLAPVVSTDLENPFLTLQTTEDLPPVVDGPKVSVFMACYNAAEYIRLAVGSMQDQTWKNLEIIIHDDCSTDGSFEILQEIAAADPRVLVTRNETNSGTYGNRNQMLTYCTGEYVTVHDCDDWSHPQMIERQMAHLAENPDIRLNTTLMCRVSLDLYFHLRPSRASLEFCHMNYPGFLMRTEDIKALGGWDPIMANADAEFERRVKRVFGKDSFAIIDPEVPYSFFLVHDNSLTQQKLMNLRSLTFGSRNEYHRQSEYWMAQREPAEDANQLDPFVVEARTSRRDPFPCPNSLLPPALKRSVLEFDVLIVSDLFLLGGTRGCNLNYIRMMHEMGKTVGLFNYPRGDLPIQHDINAEYRRLAQEGIVEIVTWEDTIEAKSVLFHHPPILNIELDKYPAILTERASILINQLPFQTQDRERQFYEPAKASELACKICGVDEVEWIAISPLTKRYIDEYAGRIKISKEIWYPPLIVQPELITVSPEERFARMAEGTAVFGRHTRDHWTKWPSSTTRTRQMYMTDSGATFRLLGGGKTVRARLSDQPENWEVFEYDGISVPEFLNGIDIYLNFNNEIYIEEFGRNVMEAMTYGIPVIADKVFAETFGDAILTVDQESPEAHVERLLSDQAFFQAQVAKGFAFVQENCATDSVVKKLVKYLG